MFEHAQLVLYNQFTEERLWGLALLALSIAVAAIPTWQVWTWNSGWQRYVAALMVFAFVFLLAAKGWGIVLSNVRKRWFV